METDGADRIAQLERHVARLDAELAELRTRLTPQTDGPAASAGPSAATGPATWAPPAQAMPPPAWSETAAAPVRPAGFEIDSETLLKWGGVGLVVLAVGFAVSTAISRGWIGPELQLAGAVAVSLALIGTGLRLRPSRPRWTHALCSGGVLALFTTVASDLFLDQVPDRVAFGSTVAIAGAGLALARIVPSEWVGAATLAGGAIAWGVIGADGPPYLGSLVWYVALVGATIAVSLERRWFAVRLAAHLTGMIALLALAAEVGSRSDWVLLGVATALVAGSLFTVPSIGDLTSTWQQLEVQLAIVATPWAYGVTFASVLEGERDAVVGWTAIAFAAATAIVATLLRARLRPPHHVSLLVGASVALSIGLAVLLSATAAFVAIAVQGAGLVVLARSLGDSLRVFVNSAIVLAVAGIWVTGDMIAAWRDDASVGTDIAHALVVVALAAAGWLTGMRVVHVTASAITLVLVLVWTGSVLVHLPQGQALVSIAWAAIGTAVFVTGAVRGIPEVGVTGLAVLGLTVAKLLTVDLQEVDTLWRAGLFFLVGIGLMRLGFTLPRLGRDTEHTDHTDHTDAEPTGAADSR